MDWMDSRESVRVTTMAGHLALAASKQYVGATMMASAAAAAAADVAILKETNDFTRLSGMNEPERKT